MRMSSLEHSLLQELEEYVEKLTTSGQPKLDEELMKKLKKICKQSDGYVKHTYEIVCTQLEKQHSEIRLSALQIIDELFNRSHCFRESLLSDFQYFLQLTAEVEGEIPLPPPKAAAKQLKTNTLEAVHRWYDKFGDVYKKLALAYNYLKTCKKIDFSDIQARSTVERRRSEDRQQRQEALQRERVNKVMQEIQDTKPEMRDNLTQLENCLQLLLPDPSAFQILDLKSPTADRTINPWTRSHQSPKYSASSGHSYTKDHSSSRKAKSSTGEKSVHEQDERGPEHSTVDEKIQSTCKSTDKNDDNKSSCNETDSGNVPSQSEQEEDEDEDDFREISSEEEDEDDEDFEDISDSETNAPQQSDFVRQHGLGSQKYSINIELTPDLIKIQETPDNTDVIHNLRDLYRLLVSKHLPTVSRWLEVLAKNGGDRTQVHRALDFKTTLTEAKKKVCHLKVKLMPKPQPPQDKKVVEADKEAEEEEDDFEDVPEKEGYEPKIPDHMRQEYGLVEPEPKPSTSRDWAMPKQFAHDDSKDPTTAAATLQKLEKKLSREIIKDEPHSKVPKLQAGPSLASSSKAEGDPTLLEKAPVVPFGTDLYHWGEDKTTVPLMVSYHAEHRFWTPNESEDVVDKNALESIKSRVINFTGKFEPVKWRCRAPLPNGTLCPRMDRVKCPFHGKIIPRDEHGQPSNAKDKERLQLDSDPKPGTSSAEWDDPELQRDIEAATGIQLTRKGKGRGRGKDRQRKYPNLTDLKQYKNTSRSRLEKRVLSKGALRRVADAQDSIDNKRLKDKFGNTFVNTYRT